MEEMLGQMLQVEHGLVIDFFARSFPEKMLWGSLAAGIAHELPVSVLIVRDRRDTINEVLIGVSRGGFTEGCSGWGGRITATFGARVTLLHVSPAAPLMYGGMEKVAETLTELVQADTSDA
jgi:hypothetical protein